MANIKISQLNPYPTPQLVSTDFLPVDQSSSLVTYRASIQQLQSTLSTGSLYGTSSWAVNALTASYLPIGTYLITSSWAQTASIALTASYAANASGALNGNGTNTYIPVWTGNTTLGNSNIYYSAASSSYISNNSNFEIINNVGGQSNLAIISGYNSSLILESYYTASDQWVLVSSAGNSGQGGILQLYTISSSNNLASKQGTVPSSYGFVYGMEILSNGYYFWPLPDAGSIGLDGTFNIGTPVTANNSSTYNTSSRLQIFVYSGSNASNPQIYRLNNAINVTYGSGSNINTVFNVSSSGQVYSTGYNVISSSGYQYTASLASGSFSVLEDNGLMYLFARSANGKLRSASLA
jgi:hypothetical protein